MSRTKNNNRHVSVSEKEQYNRTLEKYYPLDRETNTYEIPMHYEKASDLFYENCDVDEASPRFSEEITDQISEVLDDIPRGYRADFSITIGDYEGYSSKQLMEWFKDALFLRHHRFLHESTRKGLRIGCFIVIGVVIILIQTIGKQIGWWGGDDTVSGILSYMLDTLGCVFIWEGLYMIFLEEKEEVVFKRKIYKKVSTISFYNEHSDKATASENRESIYALMATNRKKLYAKRMLLISGYSMIALSVGWLLQTIGIMINPQLFGEKIDALITLDFVFALLLGAIGALALLVYAGILQNRLIFLLLAIFIFYPTIHIFVVRIGNGQIIAPTEVILGILIILAGMLFVIGLVMDYVQYKQEHSAKKGS